jgi:hypothetical protein
MANKTAIVEPRGSSLLRPAPVRWNRPLCELAHRTERLQRIVFCNQQYGSQRRFACSEHLASRSQ